MNTVCGSCYAHHAVAHYLLTKQTRFVPMQVAPARAPTTEEGAEEDRDGLQGYGGSSNGGGGGSGSDSEEEEDEEGAGGLSVETLHRLLAKARGPREGAGILRCSKLGCSKRNTA